VNRDRRAGASRAARLSAHASSFLALALGALAATAPGCGHAVAKGAVAGLHEQTRRAQAETPPEQQVARVAATRFVEGAVAALDQPQERARVQKMVDAAVAQAVEAALAAALAAPAPGGAGGGGSVAARGPGRGFAALVAGQVGRAATEDALGRVSAQLGADGPLRGNIAATSAVATNAALSAALGEIFPGCPGDDAGAAECRRAQLQALTRATAANITAGVRDSIGWPLLFLAALAGVVAGAVGYGTLVRRRRAPRALRHA